MSNLVSLESVRNKAQFKKDDPVALTLFQEMMMSCDNYQNTEQYVAFMSAIKALKDSNKENFELLGLDMEVHLDRTNDSLTFKFRFETEDGLSKPKPKVNGKVKPNQKTNDGWGDEGISEFEKPFPQTKCVREMAREFMRKSDEKKALLKKQKISDAAATIPSVKKKSKSNK